MGGNDIQESSYRNQYIGALIITLPSILSATVLAWPSYTLPLLRSASSPIEGELSVSQAAWLGSIPCIGGMVGALLGGALMDIIGRKKTAFVCGLPFLTCWLTVLFASNISTILVARFIGGLAIGMVMLASPCFLVEFVETSIRGKMMACIPLMYYVGILLSYVLGGIASYLVVNLIFVSLTVLFLAVVPLMPESPVFLMKKGREKEAIASLAWYRCAKPYASVVQQELMNIRAQLQGPVEMVQMPDNEKDPTNANSEQQNLNDSGMQQKSSDEKQSTMRSLFSSPTSRKALVLCSVLFILIPSTGTLALQTYAGVIFEKVAPSLPSHACSVFLAVFLMLGCVASSGMADSAGRKVLMISSLVGLGLCMGFIGLVLQTGWGPGWLVVALTGVCVFVNSIGAGTIPFVLLGELFVPEVRGVATTIVVEMNWLMGFVLLSAYEPLVELLNIYSVFYIFAAISFISCLFCICFIPETKGLSITEIQEMLAGNRREKNVLGTP